MLEYLILRLTFINPVHLPAMTECYLRKDFHFAMYLAYAYGKVLKKFFQLSLLALFLLLILVITANLIFEVVPSMEIQMYCAFSVIFVVLIILILLQSCLTSAEKRITPNIYDVKSGELRDPSKFNILFNEG